MITITRRLTIGIGALLTATTAAVPAIAAAGGPLFSGTYAVAPYGSVVHVSSQCGGCNAVGVDKAAANFTWTGAGWESTYDAGCGMGTTVLTPTAVVNGVVQELTASGASPCTGPVVANWSRVGD